MKFKLKLYSLRISPVSNHCITADRAVIEIPGSSLTTGIRLKYMIEFFFLYPVRTDSEPIEGPLQ
jgi:hypothetical protein